MERGGEEGGNEEGWGTYFRDPEDFPPESHMPYANRHQLRGAYRLPPHSNSIGLEMHISVDSMSFGAHDTRYYDALTPGSDWTTLFSRGISDTDGKGMWSKRLSHGRNGIKLDLLVLLLP